MYIFFYTFDRLKSIYPLNTIPYINWPIKWDPLGQKLTTTSNVHV